MTTLHDRYVAALVNLGRGKVIRQTCKYTVLLSLSAVADGKPTYFYVGHAGAVRWGKSQSESMAKSAIWKAGILKMASNPEVIGI